MFTLTDQICLVSGAASGIGLAIVECFAQAGAFVYLSDVNEEAGKAEATRLQAAGAAVAFLPLDVTDPFACQHLAKKVLTARGRLDCLVNNAGVGGVGTMLTTTPEDMDRMYQVNVKGVFNLSQAFLPHMVERGKGNIIHMASIGGVVGLKDRLAYTATKFAVVGMTKAMALDHAKQGIRVNAICPGRVETPFVQARIAEYPDPEKAYEELSATQPMGRMAKPEEVASVALYLASEASAFVTGAMHMVDGGWGAG
ncbi:MAG: SDR family oxidoreductase [Bacteroidota bacterium]